MKYSADETNGAERNPNRNAIACPNCGHQFELSEVLTDQIRRHLKDELTADLSNREKELKRKLDAFKTEKESLAKQREGLDEEVEKKVRQRAVELEAKALRKAESEFADQLKELQDTVKDQNTALRTLRANELELRKKKQDLEREKEEFDLKVLRKVEEESGRIRQDAEQRIAERHRLKELEKDKLIADLKGSLEEMKRKAEQGSVQTQGEVLELEFEDRLQMFFADDLIQPVPKGVTGADLIQSVLNPSGAECGIILWETKNTKAWSGQWIPKLKDDMITTRASIAILVSVALPEGVKRFGLVDGVWVADPASALPLATALRQQLVAVNCERQSQLGKNEKMELLYQYLAGPEFKQKIEGIVEAFTSMHGQIQKERRVMEKQWNEREKQIRRVLRNTSALYGDMQGIIGGQIPAIPALELETVPAELSEFADESDDEEFARLAP